MKLGTICNLTIFIFIFEFTWNDERPQKFVSTQSTSGRGYRRRNSVDRRRSPNSELLTALSTDNFPSENQIRLVGGVGSSTSSSARREGNVEIFHNGQWGSICDDEWDDSEADIICKSLGFSDANRRRSTATVDSQFGYAKPLIWMDNIYCEGRESSIDQCRFDGWGVHDCEITEAAGVICEEDSTNEVRTSTYTVSRDREVLQVSESRRTDSNERGRFRDPILRIPGDFHGLPSYEDQRRSNTSRRRIRPTNSQTPQNLGRMKIKLQSTYPEDPFTGRLEYQFENDIEWHSICGDGWSMREAIVACKQLGLGYVFYHSQIPYDHSSSPQIQMFDIHCQGYESNLDQCQRQVGTTTSRRRCPASLTQSGTYQQTVAAVSCTQTQSDLIPDLYSLQTSVYLEDKQLFYLQCAMEENCVSSTAYQIQRHDPNFFSHTRRLLRFTTAIENVGDADFRPFIPKSQWEWHACHQHFHSMEVFAHFDILDMSTGRRVAEGHKASFCLEDNECLNGGVGRYDCENYGDQGISPGCKDIYYNNIDCQWIDLTDVPTGTYIFHMAINPEYKVAEQTFENNAATCLLIYTQQYATIHNCSLTRPPVRRGVS